MTIGKRIDLLEETVVAVDALLQGFKVVPRTKKQKLFALVTLNHMLRQAYSILSMMESGNHSAVTVVTRSIFESFVDLENLFRHVDDYPEYMEFICDHQWFRAMKRILTDTESLYAATIRDRSPISLGKSVEDLVEDLEQNLINLKEALPSKYFKGKKVDTRVLKRFKLAGKEAEYYAMYSLWSLPAHGTIGSMVDGVSFEDGISWPPERVEYPNTSIDYTTAMLIDGGKRLAKKYRKKMTQLNRCEQQLQALRQEEATS